MLFRSLTEETWETIATLTDWTELLKKKKRYRKTEEEGEGYDMDSAWKEILADERARGREEGREEGRESRNIEIAKIMISEKEPIEKIMAYTGLSEKEIQSLN